MRRIIFGVISTYCGAMVFIPFAQKTFLDANYSARTDPYLVANWVALGLGAFLFGAGAYLLISGMLGLGSRPGRGDPKNTQIGKNTPC